MNPALAVNAAFQGPTPFKDRPLSLSNLVALLRWNLFTHKDLWKWIDDPFLPPPEPPPDISLQPELDGMQAC